MRGAVVILICTIAFTNAASVQFKVNRNEDSDTEDVGGNSDPSEAAAICAVEDSDGTLVANEICNWYYVCAGGAPVSMKCPDNLLYNYNNEQCDWPENVECGDRVISEEDDDASDDGDDDEDEIEDSDNLGNGTNSDPSEAPAICAAEESDGILIAHEYCNFFYICSSYQPVGLKCPQNLVYNYKKEQCDWPENVDCGDRVINEEEEEDSDDSDSEDESEEVESDGGNSDPSEAPTICAAAESDGVLVANENCNQFYNCWNGRPVTQVCPTNLLFNPARSYCDWPENVDCGDRVIE